MKKRILDILLIALLIVNICSCNSASKGDIDDPFETIDDTKLIFEETNEKIPESETSVEIKPPRRSPDSYNGVRGNSNVTYAFNQNSEFVLHIADWGEDHLVTSLSNKDIDAVKCCAASVCVNNERAFLFLTRAYEPKITVISFERVPKVKWL